MTLEDQSEQSETSETFDKDSLKSFVLKTKMADQKEEYKVIAYTKNEEKEEASASGQKENMEIVKKNKPRRNQTINYYLLEKGKINRFEPTHSAEEGISINDIYFNIDCEIKPDVKISQWVKENLAVATAQEMDIDTAFEFFRNSTKGIASAFLIGLGEENLNTFFRSARSLQDLATKLENAFYWEFVGTELTQTTNEYRIQSQKEAIRKLNQIMLCDMCKIEEYLCVFKEIFYQSLFNNSKDPLQYSRMVFHKISPPFGMEMETEYYKEQVFERDDSDTLGRKIKFIKEW